MDFNAAIQILDSSVRLMVPLLLACLAGLYSERSGVFDIGLEGKMLIAAFTSAAVAAVTGNAWLGLAAGIGGSMAMALVHGVASITFRGNQLIAGVAINMLAAGLTVLVGQAWFGLGGRTPSLSGAGRFNPLTLPGVETLRPVPILGPLYAEVVSGHNILVYLALACVPATWWLLYRTRFGLRLRAVGENPASVDTAGVSVNGLRHGAVLICGALCGVAGSYMATGLGAGFVANMTAGRGFIALAALIFAKWRPWWALGATFLFALFEALANRWPSFGLTMLLPDRLLGWLPASWVGWMREWLVVPSAFMNALPYILTVVILAGFVGRAIPPRAGGEPYVKER